MLPCWDAGSRPADRVLRRQRRVHRRRRQGVVHRRHPGPVRSLRLARGARRRRPRRCRDRRRHPRRARGHRSPVAPVLQDDHRVRRSEQGGQGIGARRAARRRRGRGRARRAGLVPPALRDPRRHLRRLGRPPTGRRAPRGMAGAIRILARQAPSGRGRVRATDVGRAAGRLDGDLRASRRGGGRRSREHRVAQGVPERPGGTRADAAGADRRLRRPHGVEPHEMERVDGPHPQGRGRELHLLRGARVRDGRGVQRHRRARRLHPVHGHLPDVLGVRAGTRFAWPR